MKVKNTSKRVIKLLHGNEKVTLLPGTGEDYEVNDSEDVRFYIAAGDLTEVAVRSKQQLDKTNDEKKTQGNATKPQDSSEKKAS